jgi:hypothetical protein
MRFQKAIICAVPGLFLACQTVPEGFTPEAWERLQRDNPNAAQVISWVDRSSERRDLRRKCLAVSQPEFGGQKFMDIWFMDQAQFAMLQGEDLKKHLVGSLQESIAKGQVFLEREREVAKRFPEQSQREGMTEICLRRDKALLEAISR